MIDLIASNNDFHITLWLVPLVVGPIFVIAGLILWTKPPKKINNLYGYRTRTSMRTQETWDFAQIFSAKLMVFWGSVYTLTALFAKIWKPEPTWIGFAAAMILLLVFAVIPIWRTEQELSKRFPK